MCVVCMNHNCAVQGEKSSCPMCRKKIPTGVTFLDEITPPVRDLQTAFGKNALVKCPKCTHIGSPKEVIRHFFQECDEAKINCPDCGVVINRKYLTSHPCRSVQCEHQGCNFKLFEDQDHHLNQFHQSMHEHVLMLEQSMVVRKLDQILTYRFDRSERSQELLVDILFDIHDSLEEFMSNFRRRVLIAESDVPHLKERILYIKKLIIKVSTIFRSVLHIEETLEDEQESEEEEEASTAPLNHDDSDSDSDSSSSDVY